MILLAYGFGALAIGFMCSVGTVLLCEAMARCVERVERRRDQKH